MTLSTNCEIMRNQMQACQVLRMRVVNISDPSISSVQVKGVNCHAREGCLLLTQIKQRTKRISSVTHKI